MLCGTVEPFRPGTQANNPTKYILMTHCGKTQR